MLGNVLCSDFRNKCPAKNIAAFGFTRKFIWLVHFAGRCVRNTMVIVDGNSSSSFINKLKTFNVIPANQMQFTFSQMLMQMLYGCLGIKDTYHYSWRRKIKCLIVRERVKVVDRDMDDGLFPPTAALWTVRARESKDFLLDRIEHEYLFYCSNLNSYFLIFNPCKYHMSFKIDCAV